MGWVVFLPDGRRRAGAAIVPPNWVAAFTARQTQIHIGEALAALSVLFVCQDSVAGLRVLHFVDNQAALANLIAGSSSCLDCAAVVVWYQLLTTDAAICPWFEYVESHLNIADLPSRLLLAFAEHPLAKQLGILTVEEASLPPMEDSPRSSSSSFSFSFSLSS